MSFPEILNKTVKTVKSVNLGNTIAQKGGAPDPSAAAPSAADQKQPTKKDAKETLKKAKKNYSKELGEQFTKKSGLDYLSKKGKGLTASISGPSALGFLGGTDKIQKLIMNSFYIAGVILVIIGAISLPILLILVLTYFTIKYVAGKIVSL
jgi:hypothetical protein